MEVKMAEKKAKKIPLVRLIICAVVAVLLIAVLIAGNYLLDTYAGTIDDYMGWNSGGELLKAGSEAPVKLVDDWADHEDDALVLNAQIGEEGFVLLKNLNNVLPLESSAKKINMFGAGSVNIVHGGFGSGATPNQYKKTDGTIVKLMQPKESLEKAGFQVNEALYNATYKKEEPNISKDPGGGYSESHHYQGIDLTVTELQAATSDTGGKTLLQHAKDYSDVALIVFSRSGCENYQMTEDYLKLTKNENDMLNLLMDNFGTIIIALNTSNALENIQVFDDARVSAVLWMGNPGLQGASGLGKILAGTTNPSGKMVSTWSYAMADAPAAQNTEKKFAYSNYTDWPYTSYSEGIYVGYRWFTTAAHEGIINFDEKVLYPFGYGLSYSQFEWSAGELEVDTSAAITKFSVDITVKNNGPMKGKDVIQVYCNAPYTDGGIEKAYVALTAYAKTDELDVGEENTYTLEWDAYNLASYDYQTGENGTGRYIVEKGDYNFFVMSDCYSVSDAKTQTLTWNLSSDIIISKDPVTGTDVRNEFKDAGNYSAVTYLSRKNNFANLKSITCGNLTTLSDAYKAQAKSDYGVTNDTSLPKYTQPDKTDKINDLDLIDLRGLDYDDAKWDKFVDQFSSFDMIDLVSERGYGTMSVAALGIPETVHTDGPNGISTTFAATQISGIAMPSAPVVAANWNKEIDGEIGFYLAKQALNMGFTAWYGPGLNLHRSSGLGGRNYEYYSEDSLLSGYTGGHVIKAGQAEGLVCVPKHFVLNDQETNRNGIITWANEQTIRQIYFKSFEYAVKIGKPTGIMSSFNRIGAEWVGASKASQVTILRDEWGFRGFNITDYSTGAYMGQGGAQGIRAGQDKWMSGNSPKAGLRADLRNNPVSSVYYLRKAVKNICYMLANSDIAMNGIQPGAVYSDVVSGSFIASIWINVIVGIGIAVCVFFIIWLLLPQIKTLFEKIRNKNKE